MKIGAIVLARSDSTRLPGKALLDFAGKPMIVHVLEIARRTHGVDSVLLATTDRTVDDALCGVVADHGFSIVRGNSSDVAGRFLKAMIDHDLQAALRLNGDSPLHRHALLSAGVARFRAYPTDLVTNVPGRTWPFGISVEVVGRGAMERVNEGASPFQQEHVTRRIYDEPENFAIHQLPAGPLSGRSRQLAVDTPVDYERAVRVAEKLGSGLFDAELIEVLQSHV